MRRQAVANSLKPGPSLSQLTHEGTKSTTNFLPKTMVDSNFRLV
jgi:hypothetical protein